MKYFISADLEGVTGVTQKSDITEGKQGYKKACKFMTADVNAAVEEAFENGATKIVVNDSHGGMCNLNLEDLDKRVQLIRGSHKPLCMMQGIDKSYTGAMFIGYHSMAGTRAGVINHSFSDRVNIKMNGKLVGEMAINAVLAGYYNVPVICVTGDDKVCTEAKKLLGDVASGEVKIGINRWVARCYPPSKTREIIKQTVRKAINNIENIKPYKPQTPITFEVEFMTTSEAEKSLLIPGIKSTGSREVLIKGENIIGAFHVLLAAIIISNTARE